MILSWERSVAVLDGPPLEPDPNPDLDGHGSRALGRVGRRLWAAPLLAHALLLLAVLAGLAAWIGPGYSFTSDEGASILQAQAIAHGHWVIPAPIPSLDKGGKYYPIELSAGGPKGYAPLGKHLFYGLFLAQVYRLAGVVGMVGLSLFGTVACALLAAALSRELAPGLERLALWFTALGTPLLFDGFLVVGQTVAAALATAAALLALRYLREGTSRLLLAGPGCCALACLLRTEAVIWCAALGAATMLAGILVPRPWPRSEPPGARSSSRSLARRGLVSALALATAAVAARVIDGLLTRHALGTAPALTSTPAQGQSLTDQIHGAFTSLLQAGSNPWSNLAALMVVALAIVACLARVLKRGRGSSLAVIVAAGILLAVWGFRAFSNPADPIPGLAVAAPVVWTGVWLSDRSHLKSVAGWICLAAPALFCLGVVATEYADGGGLQWGGRFYAVSLPVLVPVALVSLARQGRRLAPVARRLTIGTAVALSVILASSALWTLRATHSLGRTDARALAAAARQAPAGDGGTPVMVTSDPVWPRYEWALFPDVRWQLVPTESMRAWSTQLATTGVQRFVLVTGAPEFEIPAVSHSYTPGNPQAQAEGYYTVIFTRAAPSSS